MNDDEEMSLRVLPVAMIGTLIFWIPVTLISAGTNALALYELWKWYLADRFEPLSFASAFGLALIGKFIVFFPPAEKPPSQSVAKAVLDATNPFLVPLFTLAAGWIGIFFFQ